MDATVSKSTPEIKNSTIENEDDSNISVGVGLDTEFKPFGDSASTDFNGVLGEYKTTAPSKQSYLYVRGKKLLDATKSLGLPRRSKRQVDIHPNAIFFMLHYDLNYFYFGTTRISNFDLIVLIGIIFTSREDYFLLLLSSSF